ncbi:MAG: hypothetical protein ABMB14_23190 [Myxococcota bacterium]
MSRRDPILDELASFDESDLPELGPEWDEVAAGASPPEGEVSALAEAAREALQPMDPAVHHRIAHFAAAHYQRRTDPPRARSAWWSFAVLGGAVTAMALVVAGRLWVEPPADLAPYRAEWRSGALDVRGETAPAVGDCRDQASGRRFVPGSRFELTLAPATAATHVEARVMVDGDHPLPVEISPAGVVTIRGTASDGALDLPPGWHCLSVTLSSAEGGLPPSEPGGQHIEIGFWLDPAGP